MNEKEQWYWLVSRIFWGAYDPEEAERHQALAADSAEEARLEAAFKRAHPSLF